MAVDNEKEIILSFIAEWFDPHPQVVKKYLLKYYVKSHEIEMKEVVSGRKFLKRTKIDSTITREEFFVDATVILFSRHLKLIDYGDNETRTLLDVGSEKSVVIFTPNCANSCVGHVIASAEEVGLSLVDLKAFVLGSDVSFNPAEVLGLNPDLLNPSKEQSTHYYVAIEFRGEKALACLAHIVKSYIEVTENQGIVAALTTEDIGVYRDLFLSKSHGSTVRYNATDSTCCVLKAHVIKGRMAGSIINEILARGFDISAMQLFHLDRARAAEFYEVYGKMKGFHEMVDELSSTVLVMEIVSDVNEFRAQVGPWDIDMATSLRPDTIRAKFGNAIHCTDLPEDNINELTYFFDILASEE